jgi:hypothetical protein
MGKRVLVAILAMVIGLVLLNGASASGKRRIEGAQLLSRFEAEVLVNLVPAAQKARSSGADVSWIDYEPKDKLAMDDCLLFRLYSTSRSAASGTIGHYAVDLRTATVWTLTDFSPVNAPDLRVAQEILRRAHGIEESTVRSTDGSRCW